MVLSFHKYREVMTHAGSAVAALYQAGLQHTYTITHVHNALSSSGCAICDRFGAYVSILDLKRYCQRCVQYDPQFQPVALDVARRIFEIRDEEDIDSLPKIIGPTTQDDFYPWGYQASPPRSRSFASAIHKSFPPSRSIIPPNFGIVS